MSEGIHQLLNYQYTGLTFKTEIYWNSDKEFIGSPYHISHMRSSWTKLYQMQGLFIAAKMDSQQQNLGYE
jgi:hypothetical protein